MKRISHQRKRDTLLMQHFQDVPKARMKYWIATRNIKIGEAVHLTTHFATRVDYRQAALPTHLDKLGMPLAEDVAMLATLVADIGDVPLKCKVFHLRLLFFVTT
jgi:hypothetical protein